MLGWAKLGRAKLAASIFHPVCPSQGMSYVLKKTGWKIEPALQTHIKAHPERDVKGYVSLTGCEIELLLRAKTKVHP